MMCLYTTLFIVMFFGKNAEIAKIQMDNRYTHALQQARDNIDTKMVIGQSLANQLVTSENVLEYTRQKQRNYYTIAQVFREISDSNSSFGTVGCSVAICKFDDSLIITPQHTVGIEGFYQQMGFDYEQRKQIQELTAVAENDQDSVYVSSVTKSGVLTFTTVQVKYLTNGEKLTVYISYPMDKLFPATDPEEEHFFMGRDQEWISDRLEIPEDLSIVMDKWRQEDGEAEEDGMGIDGYYVYTARSQETNWHYIYAVSKSELSRERALLAVQMLMIYIGLLCLGLLLIYIVTNRIYGPIRKILSHIGGSNETNDEMAFLAEAIHEMQQKNQTLTEVVQADTASLENKDLKGLLDGVVPEVEIPAMLGRYQLQWMKREVLATVLEFANQRDLEALFSRSGMMILKSEVIEMISERLRQETVFKMVEYDYKRYVVIIKDPEKDRLIQIFSKVLSELEADFEITVVASIGEPCGSAAELAQEFEQTIGILENRSPFDKRIILTGRESQEEGVYYYPIEMEMRLMEAIANGEEDVVQHLVELVTKENFEKRTLDDRTFTILIMALAGTVSRALQQAGKQSEEVFGEGTNIYLELRMCENRQALQDKFVQMCSTLIRNSSHSGEEQDNKMAQNMINFVQEHFHEDISLMDLGQAFNLSTCYISTLFKQYTGENFKDYLNTYRVSKAKQLLQEGRLQVKEVGEQVGYLNTPSFIRAFKRYEGTSPGQYMKNHQK